MAASLAEILGCSHAHAAGLLEAYGGDTEAVINGELGEAPPARDTPAPAPAAVTAGASRRRPPRGRKQKSKRRRTDLSPPLSATTAAPAAAVDEDGVRAPMARTVDRLVDDPFGVGEYYDPYGGGHSIRTSRSQKPFYESMRDFAEEMKDSEAKEKYNNLAIIFRPPLELIHQGDLEIARSDGRRERKWVLVNIQDMSDFACQCLNRDVFRSDTVRVLIRNSFVFWQRPHDSRDGLQYMKDYGVDGFPHLATVDPRTGKRTSIFSAMNITADTFTQELLQFLDSNSLELEDSPKRKSIGAQEEDDDVAQAIRASLREAVAGSSSNPYTIENLVESSDEELFISPSESDDNADNTLAFPVSKKARDYSASDATKSDHSDTSSDQRGSDVQGTVKPNIEVRDEPAKDVKDAVHIRFTFPDNTKITRRFFPDDHLWCLGKVAEKHGYPTHNYDLFRSYPQAALSTLDPGQTLQAAGFKRENVHVTLKSKT